MEVIKTSLSNLLPSHINRRQCALAASVGAVAGAVIFYAGASALGSMGSLAVATGGGIAVALVIAHMVATTAVFPALSERAQEALAFARQKIAEGREVQKPTHIDRMRWQPVNQEIVELGRASPQAYLKLAEALQVHQNEERGGWLQDEVIQAADEYMKICFAISYLTLEDISAFRKQFPKKGTVVEILTLKDSYFRYTFFMCKIAYHTIRSGWVYQEAEGDFLPIDGSHHPRDIPPEHADLFYQEGTLQRSWRELANEYCRIVRGYVSEKALRKADGRYADWIVEETINPRTVTDWTSKSFTDGAFWPIPCDVPRD